MSKQDPTPDYVFFVVHHWDDGDKIIGHNVYKYIDIPGDMARLLCPGGVYYRYDLRDYWIAETAREYYTRTMDGKSKKSVEKTFAYWCDFQKFLLKVSEEVLDDLVRELTGTVWFVTVYLGDYDKDPLDGLDECLPEPGAEDSEEPDSEPPAAEAPEPPAAAKKQKKTTK